MVKKKRGYWSKVRCQEEALNFNTRGEFSIKSRTCYSIATKNKWLDDICNHMMPLLKKRSYWTFDKCQEVALKCTSQKEFYKNYRMAHDVARENNWLIDIRKHMDIIGNKYKRLIYAIEFKDKSIYIGLTYNIKQRYYQHLNKDYSTVYKYIKKIGLNPICIPLTDLLDVEDAIVEEKNYIEKYKNDGYLILNKSKAGAIGGSNSIKWTFENCKKEALKYESRNEFCVNSGGAYQASIKHSWLDEVCKHMKLKHKPKGYWTYEKCKESSILCKNKEEFYKKFGGAFSISKKNGWLNYLFPKKDRKSLDIANIINLLLMTLTQ